MPAHVQNRLDFHSDPILHPEVGIEESSFSRSSADNRAPITAYGRVLMDPGCVHHMVIYEAARWPTFKGFTCFASEVVLGGFNR